MCQPYLGAHYHIDQMLDVNTIPTLSEPCLRVQAYSASAKPQKALKPQQSLCVDSTC